MINAGCLVRFTTGEGRPLPCVFDKQSNATSGSAMFCTAGRGAERQREHEAAVVPHTWPPVVVVLAFLTFAGHLPQVRRWSAESTNRSSSLKASFSFKSHFRRPAVPSCPFLCAPLCTTFMNVHNCLPISRCLSVSLAIREDTFLSFGWSCARKTTTKPTRRWRNRSPHISTSRERPKNTWSG